MAKEIADIINAYKQAKSEGRKAALATVVCVEGSSYRMPGARMLVEDNGRMTGAISGGCLEGDALRKALLAINQCSNKLVTYNSLYEDDLVFGVQLGCNGVVHILFEPIDPDKKNNPVALLERFYRERKNAVLVTLYSLSNVKGPQPGTCFFLNDQIRENGAHADLNEVMVEEAATVLHSGASLIKQYPEQQLTVFYELLCPPVSLVIVGAGNDSLPLVDFANVLGWPVTVLDGRNTHANKKRFPKVEKIFVGKPADVIPRLEVDDRTVFILMSHNYNYDLEVMKFLRGTKARYIGTLGPKKRLERIIADMEAQGINISEKQIDTIYGPTGLDIGAETPEEIALSVIAEIKAVLSGRVGSFLRAKPAAIHARPRQEIVNTTEGLHKI